MSFIYGHDENAMPGCVAAASPARLLGSGVYVRPSSYPSRGV